MSLEQAKLSKSRMFGRTMKSCCGLFGYRIRLQLVQGNHECERKLKKATLREGSFSVVVVNLYKLLEAWHPQGAGNAQLVRAIFTTANI
eukprot:691557-Amphidinium_carterae.1